jgi:hypothetical protein
MSLPKIAILGLSVAATAFAAWLPPVNLAAINTTAADMDPQPGPGGTVLYFVSGRPGSYGGYDIWASYYSGGRWQTPFNLGANVNSENDERGPVFVNGTTPELYFASTRAGGKGGFDIYRCSYNGGAWQTGVDLTNINSVYNDTEPFFTSSPRRLYFASNRAGGYGGYDLYYSAYGTGAWLAPVNMGAKINTASDELGPSCADSATALYFYSNRPGGLGGYDVYFATLSGGAWNNAANIGSSINTTGADMMPGISPNGGQLYFSSNRAGGSGFYDIWGSNFNTAVTPASLGRAKASFH